MHIRITNAGRTIKRVTIEDERAVVGAVTEVSDEFVRRLKAEMPHVEFEENVQPDAAEHEDGISNGDGDDDETRDQTA